MPSKKEQYKYAKHAAPRPGDERFGAYTQAQLVNMDQRFVERMEWAFRTGHEQPRANSLVLPERMIQGSPRHSGSRATRSTTSPAATLSSRPSSGPPSWASADRPS